MRTVTVRESGSHWHVVLSHAESLVETVVGFYASERAAQVDAHHIAAWYDEGEGS